MALKTMIENLNKARKAYDEQLASLGKNAQKAVVEFLAPLIPEGCEVCWTQYTPYFNDGDACTFSVHEPKVRKVEGEDDDSERGVELSKWGIDSYCKEWWSPEIVVNDKRVTKTALTELRKAWDALPKDLLESAFGDHVEVIINADAEYSADECRHD